MTPLTLPGPVVDVAWLAAHRDHPQLVVLDAHMPIPGSAPDSAPVRQIPGARRFDFDHEICDHDQSLPHMMPSAAQFTTQVRALGIRRDSVIVAYDRLGMFSAARALWMWRAMGHRAVAVLDGGLPAWNAAGQPLEPTHAYTGAGGDFEAQPVAGLFCDGDTVARVLTDDQRPVIDARGAGRFAGRDAEPRPGVRAGHMPGAVNLPFGELLDNGHFKPVAALKARFAEAIGTRNAPILSCGSGVTACILALGAELAGYTGMTVYDGSWSDWGSDTRRLVVQD